jgi:hypothetical protein
VAADHPQGNGGNHETGGNGVAHHLVSGAKRLQAQESFDAR